MCSKHSTRHYVFYGKYTGVPVPCTRDASRLVEEIGSGCMLRNYEKLQEGITEKSYFVLGQGHQTTAKGLVLPVVCFCK